MIIPWLTFLYLVSFLGMCREQKLDEQDRLLIGIYFRRPYQHRKR